MQPFAFDSTWHAFPAPLCHLGNRPVEAGTWRPLYPDSAPLLGGGAVSRTAVAATAARRPPASVTLRAAVRAPAPRPPIAPHAAVRMEAQRQLDVYSAFEELQARAGHRGWWAAPGGGDHGKGAAGKGPGMRAFNLPHSRSAVPPPVPALCPQGTGGLYFTGEYLNGMGVPLQAYGAQALVDAHFA